LLEQPVIAAAKNLSQKIESHASTATTSFFKKKERRKIL
jgi:hypothetical protein